MAANFDNRQESGLPTLALLTIVENTTMCNPLVYPTLWDSHKHRLSIQKNCGLRVWNVTRALLWCAADFVLAYKR